MSHLLPLLLFLPFTPVQADSNGMDMSMDGAMSLAAGSMRPYIHFTPGDTLWFQGWVPQRAAAVAGACVGLFLLALVERWVAACRGVMEMHWRKRSHITLSNTLTTQSPTVKSAALFRISPPGTRSVPPFVPAHDITRGVLHTAQAALQFVFMLAAMTFQAAFLVSVVVGLGVGEMLFGRYVSTAAHIA